MEWIFNIAYILNEKWIFYGFLILMMIIIILTFVFVSKELKKVHDNK